MGQRRRARECALQMLYQIDQTRISPAEIFGQFWDSQPVADDVRSFAEHLVIGVADRREDLDGRIAGSAEHWRIDRMAVVDRNVLRIALFEMLSDAETPVAVIIDEAIEVAKRFGGEASGSFVNGILDSIKQRLDHERAD